MEITQLLKSSTFTLLALNIRPPPQHLGTKRWTDSFFFNWKFCQLVPVYFDPLTNWHSVFRPLR